MNKHFIVYAAWLAMVVIWNFGWPAATPIQDVLAAIVFAAFSAFSIYKLIHKTDSKAQE